MSLAAFVSPATTFEPEDWKATNLPSALIAFDMLMPFASPVATLILVVVGPGPALATGSRNSAIAKPPTIGSSAFLSARVCAIVSLLGASKWYPKRLEHKHRGHSSNSALGD